ncbi:MAG: nucleoside triphosphate pyrophosphohydrolase [Gammaproteobacteria bacterium]|nr:nucleoside triphosphate pyrophosphohydrolase [Gammaproteobacteria bacterium]
MTYIQKLLDIMAQLRAPDGGCPWDLEQTFETIAPYTIEEAYEVAEAIADGDMGELEQELGDLLLQVVFHARMAEEAGHFEFGDVVEAICAKMIRRHPHVFGDEPMADAKAQSLAWEEIKAQEKPSKGVLSDVPVGLPALTRAAKLGRRASRAGFDWPNVHGARAKVGEELDELDEAVRSGDRGAMEAEMGDIFFALVNMCRHLELDAEACARGANRKFQARFEQVERSVEASGRDWRSFELEELEAYWLAAKEVVGKRA